ncbi:anthranilate synthase component I [Helicobacter pylori]|nr:anthranilate synthase component I [Helicobacter pylori]
MKNQNSNIPRFLKAFEIESEATKPPLMTQSLFEAKTITISQLPLA